MGRRFPGRDDPDRRGGRAALPHAGRSVRATRFRRGRDRDPHQPQRLASGRFHDRRRHPHSRALQRRSGVRVLGRRLQQALSSPGRRSAAAPAQRRHQRQRQSATAARSVPCTHVQLVSVRRAARTARRCRPVRRRRSSRLRCARAMGPEVLLHHRNQRRHLALVRRSHVAGRFPRLLTGRSRSMGCGRRRDDHDPILGYPRSLPRSVGLGRQFQAAKHRRVGAGKYRTRSRRPAAGKAGCRSAPMRSSR